MPVSKVAFLDLGRQPADPWLPAVNRVVRSGRYLDGPELARFEGIFSSYCGTAECVGTANGTDSLELALKAVGIGPGDEVATVANAGMYSTTAIRAAGAIPVFADINPTTLLMSPAALRAVLRPRTRAVVVTHLYGLMAPMPELLAAAGSLPVIEDCAQAHGASLDGRPAGSWGVAGCFSFYPTKNLGAMGDAGAVVTSDRVVAGRLRALRQYGWTRRFESSVTGGRNSRLDEIQAAVLSEKLAFLPTWTQLRRSIARRYSEAFTGRTAVTVPASGTGSDYVAHLYVVRTRNRANMQDFLARRGIQTMTHYPIADHKQESQSGLCFRAVDLTATEEACREVLSLPCYPELSDEEASFVIASMIDFDNELS